MENMKTTPESAYVAQTEIATLLLEHFCRVSQAPKRDTCFETIVAVFMIIGNTCVLRSFF